MFPEFDWQAEEVIAVLEAILWYGNALKALPHTREGDATMEHLKRFLDRLEPIIDAGHAQATRAMRDTLN